MKKKEQKIEVVQIRKPVAQIEGMIVRIMKHTTPNSHSLVMLTDRGAIYITELMNGSTVFELEMVERQKEQK